MKKNFLALLALLSLSNTAHIQCAGMIKNLLNTSTKADKKALVAFGIVGKSEQELNNLKKQKKKLDESTKAFADHIAKQIAKITTKITETNAQLARDNSETESQQTTFLNNKLTLLNEIYQTLNEIKTSRGQQTSLIEKNIKGLEEYLKDPSLNGYKKEYRNPKKFYEFKDFQDLYQMIIEQENRIKSDEEQLKLARVEQENREQTAVATSEDYIKKKQELENFIQAPEKASTFQFNQQQQLKLLKLQETLYKTKNDLDDFRLKETEYKVDQIENKIFLEKIKLNILKKAARNIKPTIRIIESDISVDKAKLEKKIRDSYATRKQAENKINFITKENQQKSNQLNNYSQQYDIPLDIQLDQWELIPKTPDEYIKILKTGNLNEYIKRNAREREFLEVQIVQEDEKLCKKRMQLETKESFYKIKTNKFPSEEEIRKEIRKYTAYLSDIKAKIAKYTEKKNVAEDQLSIKRKALENIRTIRANLLRERGKQKIGKYNLSINQLKNAIVMVDQQIKLLQNIINVYSSIIEISNNTYKQIEFIKTELDSALMWRRPPYAIKWEEVKNIIPELQRFFNDLKTYILQFSFSNLVEKIKLAFPKTIDFIMFLIKLLMIMLLLLLFRIYAPWLHSKLLHIAQQHKGTRFFSLLAAFVIEFIIKYFVLISIWLMLFFVVQLEIIPDNYMHILFYLLSIPYLAYLTNRCLHYLASYNARNNYALFSIQMQRRVMITLSIILYATTIIFLFRKAFMMSILYYKSELPSILLALYIIIIQISLLPLLVKEQILNIIPTNTRTWRWIHVQVNKFYYPILALLIAIIILSNPYIGFSKLVGHITIRIIITVLLIKFLFWLHELIKKTSLQLFFKADEGLVQARFTYGKTTYGLSVILSFAFLVGVGLLIGAYIWGWEMSPTSLYNQWLDKAILWGDENKPITIISLFKLFLFIFSGFIFAYSINKFVLRKIFDLLLVNTGVQNAIRSILKYVVVTTFLIIGFQHIHLSKLVTYFIVTVGFSIGWILKDPLSDFAYYFIILIQRPLKIGDFIQVDKEKDIAGIVRKITPRSVIIRRKNSETILVPNSKIISNPIFNWNYTSGFVAFDDIMITIAYKDDPTRVRAVLVEVLDKHPNVLKSPRPIVRLEKFGEYGYIFLMRGFLSSHYTLDKWDIAGDIRLSLVKALRDNNIEIAVPVRMMLSTKTATVESHENLEQKGEEPTIKKE